MTQIDDSLKIVSIIFIGSLVLEIFIYQILVINKYCRKSSTTNDLTISEQHTFSRISIKLFEVVSTAVTGYYECFTICWTKSLECLTTIMLAYITFLTLLCKDLLVWPTSLIVSISSVIIVSILPILMYILVYRL